eukprot:gene33161-11382_t
MKEARVPYAAALCRSVDDAAAPLQRRLREAAAAVAASAEATA